MVSLGRNNPLGEDTVPLPYLSTGKPYTGQEMSDHGLHRNRKTLADRAKGLAPKLQQSGDLTETGRSLLALALFGLALSYLLFELV